MVNENGNCDAYVDYVTPTSCRLDGTPYLDFNNNVLLIAQCLHVAYSLTVTVYMIFDWFVGIACCIYIEMFSYNYWYLHEL